MLSLRLVVGLCIASLASSACYDRNAYTLGAGVARFLKLEPSADRLPADGNSKMLITATLTEASVTTAPSTGQVVTFGTSGGTLVAGGKTATKSSGTLAVPVNASGQAIVELQADSTVQTVRVQATINSVTQYLDIPFVPPVADDVIVLSTTASSLPADGYSRVRLTAAVKLALDATQRTVVFKTSTGTLSGAGTSSNGGKQLDVVTDASSVAVAELQSSQTVESAFVSASIAGVTRSLVIVFNAADPTQTIRLVPSVSTAQADGVSAVPLQATIAPGVVNRSVTFRASGALFTNGQAEIAATADGSNIARASIIAPASAVLAVLQATVMGTTADSSVRFTPAQPDGLLVSAQNGTISSTGNTTITVTLLRTIGSASPGQVVAYSATDGGGGTVGSFSSTTPSARVNGETRSTATFNALGAAPGTVTIRVTLGAVTATTTLVIQ